jgi:hypothetical protein
MQNLTPVQEVVQVQTKSKSKIGTKKLCNTIAYCLHPEDLDAFTNSKMLSIRNHKYKKDLRLVRNKENYLKWALLQPNKELKLLRDDEVRGIIQCSFAGYDEAEDQLGSKDIESIMAAAKDKSFHMDELSKSIKGEKFVLDEETEIRDIRFKSDDGFCFKKLDFDPDPNGSSTLWTENVLPRITHNRELFMAWVGSLFDYKSNKKKYVWFHGKTDSGKSAISTFLMSMFGNAAVTSSADKILINNWFLSSLVGKRLCCVSEAESHLVGNSKWKELTGEAYFNIQQKYKDDRTERLNVKYLVASNHLPRIPKGGEHSNRIIYTMIDALEKDKRLPEADTDRLLLEGAPWFIYQCMEEYKKNPTLYAEYDEHIDMIQEEDFKEEDFKKYFALDKDSFVTSREIDKVLMTESRTKLDRDDFKQWLLKTHKCTYQRVYVNGVQVRAITGIRKNK